MIYSTTGNGGDFERCNCFFLWRGFFGEKKFSAGKVFGLKEYGKVWGVKNDSYQASVGKIYDYSFDVSKVRDPIRKLIEDSGLKFKQVILKGDATYKK